MGISLKNLKTKINLIKITYKDSAVVMVNTLRLKYKNQQLKAE
jgi:hypothetical protein